MINPHTSFVLLFIVGLCKAYGDLMEEGNSGIPPKYWKSVSWANKWELNADGKLKPNSRDEWLYLGFPPRYQERFLYSSTLFVFFTDRWHQLQTIRALCSVLAVVFYISVFGTLLDAVLLYGCYVAGFSILYNSIKE